MTRLQNLDRLNFDVQVEIDRRDNMWMGTWSETPSAAQDVDVPFLRLFTSTLYSLQIYRPANLEIQDCLSPYDQYSRHRVLVCYVDGPSIVVKPNYDLSCRFLRYIENVRSLYIKVETLEQPAGSRHSERFLQKNKRLVKQLFRSVPTLKTFVLLLRDQSMGPNVYQYRPKGMAPRNMYVVGKPERRGKVVLELEPGPIPLSRVYMYPFNN
ncbi:hypothetical protein QBC38DRAFT_456826 [Podospora fimiseda]|uniref:Uncharacterized protein n=1 Tax=Podospora fimiseda TaxID=252190 RepID=A0AAN7BM28_9PEZI|nr:hypothetical protein QBC38DRAFT_456826 [Podospora fimiseda]